MTPLKKTTACQVALSKSPSNRVTNYKGPGLYGEGLIGKEFRCRANSPQVLTHSDAHVRSSNNLNQHLDFH